MQHDPSTAVRYLSPAELQARWGVGRTTTYETISAPGFPPPLRLGRCLRFREDHVVAWEATQTATPELPAPKRRGPKGRAA